MLHPSIPFPLLCFNSIRIKIQKAWNPVPVSVPAPLKTSGPIFKDIVFFMFFLYFLTSLACWNRFSDALLQHMQNSTADDV